MKAHRKSRETALLFLNHAARLGWVINATPRPLHPRERDPVPHRTGGWVGLRPGLDRYGKSCPPPRYDSHTVQPVANRYTSYAVPALKLTFLYPGKLRYPATHFPRRCRIKQFLLYQCLSHNTFFFRVGLHHTGSTYSINPSQKRLKYCWF
jgi:hypothetical protein